MKRSEVELTLLNAKIARTNEDRAIPLLLGIHKLLYAVAEEMGVFEDDEEYTEE